MGRQIARHADHHAVDVHLGDIGEFARVKADQPPFQLLGDGESLSKPDEAALALVEFEGGVRQVCGLPRAVVVAGLGELPSGTIFIFIGIAPGLLQVVGSRQILDRVPAGLLGPERGTRSKESCEHECDGSHNIPSPALHSFSFHRNLARDCMHGPIIPSRARP